MKNILLFPIIFAFIFSACSDFSGNEDAVEASLKPTPVTTTTTTTTTTRRYYDLNGVTFGDNTFVAVGKTGAIRTSSDNGSSWDNGTSGTTYYFNEVAYGDSIFIAVGQNGRIYTSSDNGTTWSRATWDGNSAHLTGLAYGNNISIAVSSSNVIKSTDNGANWTLKSSAVEVYDMAYGNRAASGEVATCGTITHAGDHDDGTYTSVALSGGSGSGAQATVIVSGDNVTSVSITDGGTGLYQIGDVLTIDNATIGGDIGEVVTVDTITDNGSHDNGTHFSLTLSGGSGSGAEATVILSGDNGSANVTSVSITDGGTGLYQIGDVLTIDNATIGGDDNATIRVATVTVTNATCRVATVTVTSTAFIGVGADGSVCYSTNASPQNHGEAWLCPSPIVSDKKLYGITYGNNKFIAVGQSGTVIRSDDGSVWETRTSNTDRDLYSIAFGNDRFVGVGSYTVIVSTDNGTSFLETETTLTFYDVTFGNGVFVAVGPDEKIYTSTDGDTWTKVHGK
jgi:hypothetical protein